jgi:hypothetical protein
VGAPQVRLATLAHVNPAPGHWEQSLGLIAAQVHALFASA